MYKQYRSGWLMWLCHFFYPSNSAQSVSQSCVQQKIQNIKRRTYIRCSKRHILLSFVKSFVIHLHRVFRLFWCSLDTLFYLYSVVISSLKLLSFDFVTQRFLALLSNQRSRVSLIELIFACAYGSLRSSTYTTSQQRCFTLKIKIHLASQS